MHDKVIIPKKTHEGHMSLWSSFAIPPSPLLS